MRLAAVGLALAACGGGHGRPVDAAVAADAAGDAPVPCANHTCDLTCDASDTWLAFTRGPGTGQGDAEPATPDEIGDGMWHLFVGVNEGDGSTPDVYIYDLTSATPDGTFAQPAEPLTTTRDAYDMIGSETPAYLRADAHREYVYYCAVVAYSPVPSTTVAALRRTDGGAWTKLGPVAPPLAGEATQCEPTAIVRAADGHILLSYLALDTDSGHVQQIVRDSTDPESFPAAGATVELDYDGSTAFPGRFATSFDTTSGVYRTAFDVGYPYALHTVQTWTFTPALTQADVDAALTLHDGNHAQHPQFHVDGTACTPETCPQGAVLQPSKPIYPNATDVIFYYSGWSNAPALQVNGQRCHRS
ncbi:MAG TPA: hypothetical protein VGF94_17290 [Kofleriaceae bacterium]|jgi:hypothetical protein